MAQQEALTDADLRSVAAAAEPDAFLSYAHEDQRLVEALGDGLVRAGKEVWLDREDIPFASDWRARARAGIEASKAVIFILSDHWIASEACRFELEHAVETHKRLVPVAPEPGPAPATLPPALRDLAWIPARGATDETTVADLVKTLDEDLEWRDRHARLLVRAVEWDTRGRERSLLLRGADLDEAEAWLEAGTQHDETPSPQHAAYISASRREASRRQRRALALVAAALIVSLVLGALAYWQRGVALDNEREAVAQRQAAEQNARTARSRELAATGAVQLADDPELALLLGVEAAKTAPTVQAEEVLRAALPRLNPATRLAHSGLQVIDADAGGTLAVTGGSDGTGQVWDLQNGRRLATLKGHSPEQQTDVTQGVLAVAMSSDGSFAATGGAEGDVRIWDPREGRMLHLLEAPAGGASDLGVALAVAGPAGDEVLVTGGQSGTVTTWDPASGRALETVRIGGFQVIELAVSPDGRRIAAATLPHLDGEGKVVIWDSASLDRVASLDVTAFELSFSEDGGMLATAELGTVGVWDVETGALMRELPADDQTATAAFAPDDRTIALTEGDGVALVDVASGERRSILRHTGIVSAIAFTPDGSRILTSGSDETARLWNAETGALSTTLRGHRTPVWEARFLGDGDRVLTAGSDGTARIWRPGARPAARELRGHDAVIDDVVVSPDGRRVATAAEDGTARIWDPRTGALEATLDAGSTGHATLGLSPDGKRVATSGFGPTQIWNAATGRLVDTLPGEAHGSAEFTADGAFVVTFNGDVWDMRRRRRVARLGDLVLLHPVPPQRGETAAVFVRRLEGPAELLALPSGKSLMRLEGEVGESVASAAFAPGRKLIAVNAGGRTLLMDGRTGRRIAALSGETTLQPGSAFDGRGARLLTGTAGGVRIWDVARRRPIADLPHPRPIGSAAFSPDSRLVVTASFDGFARVWEARTGRLIARFRGRSSQKWSEGFVPLALIAPDNQTVVAATGGSTAFVSECPVCAPLPELLEQAAQATTRRLTPDERLTHLGA